MHDFIFGLSFAIGTMFGSFIVLISHSMGQKSAQQAQQTKIINMPQVNRPEIKPV